MAAMIMRKEELLYCYPFPHGRNRDVDWEITTWNPNSFKQRGRRLFSASDYSIHLGINYSTWQGSEETLTSDVELMEVKILLEKHNIEYNS